MTTKPLCFQEMWKQAGDKTLLQRIFLSLHKGVAKDGVAVEVRTREL
jgi:hypothetical protein